MYISPEGSDRKSFMTSNFLSRICPTRVVDVVSGAKSEGTVNSQGDGINAGAITRLEFLVELELSEPCEYLEMISIEFSKTDAVYVAFTFEDKFCLVLWHKAHQLRKWSGETERFCGEICDDVVLIHLSGGLKVIEYVAMKDLQVTSFESIVHRECNRR